MDDGAQADTADEIMATLASLAAMHAIDIAAFAASRRRRDDLIRQAAALGVKHTVIARHAGVSSVRVGKIVHAQADD